MSEKKSLENNRGFMGFIKFIERAGNKMPHPTILFLILTLIILVASFIFQGKSVTFLAPGDDGKMVEKTVEVVNLLTKRGIGDFIANILTNYKNLSTLTLLMVVIMGESVAENSGFFSAILRKSLLNTPRKVVTYALGVIGICANICGDAGMILGATLGAIIYSSIGRNPWIGIITGYAAAAAGYTANLIPASVDANLASITQQMLDTAGLPYQVHALSNYVFMVVSTFILAGVVAFISEKFLVPFFGDKHGKLSPEELEKAALTPEEERGVKHAKIAALIILALMLLATVPKDAMLRNPDNGQLVPKSPLMSALVPLIFLIFTAIGSAYGFGSGKFKSAKDVMFTMRDGLAENSMIWVIFFFVSQMLYAFNKSNLATMIAVNGEQFLKSRGFVGLPLMLTFILIVALINLFMYSASAKWLLLAPIFIPMFTNLGIHPALTQLAYRIGDSCTNSITPLNVCLVATVEILNKYRDPNLNKDPAGVGTIISTVFVFAIGLLISFMILFSIFWVLGLPIGVATDLTVM